ncbi:MAG: DUF1343 domain-containing protein, partial [Spirochaetes bacterium]|nr:DUF1343 domain-containing protein [Spirochaetota bacterium]
KESLVPDPSHLDDIDLVLFDIQDVGSRYYTYVNTLVLFMKRIHRRGLELMVLDRPNPIGGDLVEGPLLGAGYESFMGVLPVPVRHGLTACEIAAMAREHFELDIPLTPCPMAGWTRGMHYGETGLPWIPPSPNMPDAETALCYPGFCLFEGLNVSEGRGTTVPFRVVGAPFIDPDGLAGMANALGLPGVRFRPTWFRPTFNKYAGETIGGVHVHITDRQAFRPFLSAAALVACLQELYPSRLEFLHGVYEFNTAHPAFDLLAGGDGLRKAILGGTGPGALATLWEDEESRFSAERRRHLIYHD